jgi:predicted metal-binding protein
LEALRARLKTRPEKSIAVEAVACLQVCGRPATVALAGGGKWTYTLADLDLAKEVDDLIHSAKLHAATQDGVAAWKDRPHCFRGKVVSRTPPLGFVGPQA